MDLASVNWPMVAMLAGMAFIASLVSHAVMGSKFLGAIVAAVLFAVLFVGWNYYPHGLEGRVPGIVLPKLSTKA